MELLFLYHSVRIQPETTHSLAATDFLALSLAPHARVLMD
jgi:hypothetical protein